MHANENVDSKRIKASSRVTKSMSETHIRKEENDIDATSIHQ